MEDGLDIGVRKIFFFSLMIINDCQLSNTFDPCETRKKKTFWLQFFCPFSLSTIIFGVKLKYQQGENEHKISVILMLNYMVACKLWLGTMHTRNNTMRESCLTYYARGDFFFLHNFFIFLFFFKYFSVI